MDRAICNNCGESVGLGSGKFVNRIPSGGSVEENKEEGMQFPEGEWLCEECDLKNQEEAPR